MRRWLVERVRINNSICALLDSDTNDPAIGRTKIVSAGGIGQAGMPSMSPPFIIIRALPTAPALAGLDHPVDRATFLVWVHDSPGSYEAVIGAVLFLLPSALAVPQPIRLVTGDVLMECRHDGNSGDFYDDTFTTATRYAQFTLVVRRAPSG